MLNKFLGMSAVGFSSSSKSIGSSSSSTSEAHQQHIRSSSTSEAPDLRNVLERL